MEAQRLTFQCPICHESIPRGIRGHLFDHSKSDLVDELLAFVEGEDQSEEEEE